MVIEKPSFEEWVKYRYRDNEFDAYFSKPHYEDVGLMKNLDKLKRKSKYYTFVIYPENVGNMKFKEFLEHSGQLDFAYIYHEKPDSEIQDFALAPVSDLDKGFLTNTLIKPHYHVLVKYGYSHEWASVVKSLFPWGITYCEPVSSVDDLLIYFTHRDSKSILLNKETYVFDDIVYTGEFIDRVARLRSREVTKNIINPRNDLLEFAYVCESYYEFYKYAMSDALLDKEFRTHQLIFENILSRRRLAGEVH